MKEINKSEDTKHKYEDIINMPHHVSTRYKQMSIESRAAQFAPFAALTGYGDEIKEASRLTDKKINLVDNEKDILNYKLQVIKKNIKNKPQVLIKYFIPDIKKSGGSYKIENKQIKKIDETLKKIIFMDNSYVLFENIINIKIINKKM